jgi:hypothetical protein
VKLARLRKTSIAHFLSFEEYKNKNKNANHRSERGNFRK